MAALTACLAYALLLVALDPILVLVYALYRWRYSNEYLADEKGILILSQMKLDESAKLDGARHFFVFFWQIILPLVRPMDSRFKLYGHLWDPFGDLC